MTQTGEAWQVDSVDRYELTDPDSGRTYEIGIALPLSYAATDRPYPAVVVLDGNLCFGIALDAASLQSATGEIAELIVVGVGTPRREGLAAHALKRLRDMTPVVPRLDGAESPVDRLLLQRIAGAGLTPTEAFGGADAFLAFLANRLLPFVTGRYRVDVTRLGLFGHSAGGIFTVHALLTPSSPFSHYTAGSFPADWLGDEVTARIAAFRDSGHGRHVRVYYGVGGAELVDEKLGPALRGGMQLLERLAAPPVSGIDLALRVYPEETHTSVMASLLSSAFRWHYATGFSYSQAAAARVATAKKAGATPMTAVQKLIAALPEGDVLVGADVRMRARNYWDPASMEAMAVVRPRSTEEVATVLRICHAHRQPVVPQGGRTGVCDGDRATAGDVVLSLERLAAVEEIDVAGRTVVVQAGCVLERLQQAVAAKGLYLPLDLGARGSCTIGGNVATNAGGINVIRFGMTRALVLGLEVVLADGTILSSLNRMLKNNSGYDLKQLFIGSEGTLGVVTRVVLSLEEEFTSATSALVALERGDHLAGLLKHMVRGLGGTLTSFEVMWGDHYRAVTAPGAHVSPLNRDYAFYVVMEALGSDATLDETRFGRTLESAMDAGLIADAVLPKSRQERDRIWAIREDFSAVLGDRPQYLYDVSLPIKDMMAYVADVRHRLDVRWPGARLYVLGHIGDGNLHFFISPGCNEPELHQMLNAAVYEPLVRFGGAVSAEHGIGLEKKSWLRISRTTEEIATMRLLKRSLDPHNILNPGKVIDADCDGPAAAILRQ